MESLVQFQAQTDEIEIITCYLSAFKNVHKKTEQNSSRTVFYPALFLSRDKEKNVPI